MLFLSNGNLPSKRGISTFTQEIAVTLFPEVEGCSGCSIPERRLRRHLSGLLRPLESRLKRSAKDVTDDFFKGLKDVKAELEADSRFIFENDPASTSVEEVIMSYPGFYAILVYRIAHSLAKLDVPLIPRIMTEYAHSKMGIDIHPKATIDSPFFIDHGTGIVIGETSIIGKKVQIYQGVTLGALSVKKEMSNTKRHPTVEDNVILYAGSTILGGETVVGHDSIIGGNVWLTESVPPFSLVYHQHEMKIRTKSDMSAKS